MNEQQWLTIERLGSQAEGVALDFNGPIYVPGALPGEHVLVELYYRRGKQRAGRIVAIEHAAAERGQPFCPIAERCGGCSAQHMSQQAYRQWKQRLATAQLPENVIPEFAFWGGQEQRRRVSLSYRYGKDGVTIGFFAALSHHLVPVPHCPLLIPELNYAIAALQQFLPSILKPRDEGFLHLTQTLQGLDLSWSPHRFKSTDLSSELWQAWGRFGQNFGCARITRAGKDLIAQWHKPYVDLGDVSVGFPPVSFLQPSIASQAVMQQQLMQGLEQRGILQQKAHIADLFCGLGTFTAPFFKTQHISVTAYDITAEAIVELAAVAPKHIVAQERNLFYEPLLPQELDLFDAVILDPPRAGAHEQSRHLAASQVPFIAMVSCDLGTAARDIAVLQSGGYVLEQVVLFDQFPYTAHLEALCWFKKQSSITIR